MAVFARDREHDAQIEFVLREALKKYGRRSKSTRSGGTD